MEIRNPKSEIRNRRVRIGIDVGGTFTDVVVVDNDSREVVAQLKVPTTHAAGEGVARGIIEAIERVLGELEILPDEVAFIAHSTTQATNALLEGDVAEVGVIGLGSGLETWKARIDTRVPPIELAPDRFLKARHEFVSSSAADEKTVGAIIDDFRANGTEVVAVSEAFGVDRTEREEEIVRLARRKGLFATSGHEVSTLYGLRTRTRTAVLNGAILPKMIHTAAMTDDCVRRAKIRAPLMIMRSDGGVMSVGEVRRRPIMTMLSGPAAGIAGALMYEKVSDGIFIEVGGTSADISVIRDGQPQTRPARVGGHRTYLNTLDVRTLAIAGGSMIQEKDGALADVGSRSAHIAGLAYASFQKPEVFDGARLVHLRPTARDTDAYIAIECAGGERFALTPTCAANLLGVVPDDAFAKGDPEAARRAFRPLAERLGLSPEDAARRVLEIACRKIEKQIEELIAEYGLDRQTVELVGGGGGAAALIPFTGTLMNLPARLAKKAEVISTIGVALAMVRDTVERNIANPTPAQILQVRREASDAVIRIGALPASVEVQVEVDPRRSLVRATAFGTTELKPAGEKGSVNGAESARTVAARSLKANPDGVVLAAETDGFYIFAREVVNRRFFGLFNRKSRAVRVVDKTGVVRLRRSHAEISVATVETAAAALESTINKLTDFGDAGRALPDLHLLVGARVINLSGLAETAQVLALAGTELESSAPEETVVLVATPR
ncbi:MAG: hydantoinase/oxoprolinase [Acidobacteria bacterium]|nr:hydantoinase/oxoprolinase [Acidobacteriota bacterium]